MNSEYFDLLRRLSQPIRAADLPHTLAHVHHLLEALGNPQTRFPSVVVAGSTAKGTTCVRLADLLSSAGLKVGLYTSPHLHSFRERFAILNQADTPPHPQRPSPDGIWAITAPPMRIITPSEFVEVARAVLAAEDALDTRYSTFESATALALMWFAQQQVDIAVLEVGIGGRFDAVNAVSNDLAIFTPIEAEHVAMLGGSLESVAWHKAGIIQPDGWAVTVPQTTEVMAVLEREAHEKAATLTVETGMVDAVVTLASRLKTAQAREQGFEGETPDFEVSLSLIGMLGLPGRTEKRMFRGHRVLIDGGHTPASARHLSEYVHALAARLPATDSPQPVPIRFIVGMLRDKNVAAYLSAFDAPNVHFVYAQAPGDRALTSAEMLERFRPTYASVMLTPSLNEALASVEAAPEPMIVVAGSLRMAAAAREAFGLLTSDALEEARLTRAIFEGDEYQSKLSNRD